MRHTLHDANVALYAGKGKATDHGAVKGRGETNLARVRWESGSGAGDGGDGGHDGGGSGEERDGRRALIGCQAVTCSGHELAGVFFKRWSPVFHSGSISFSSIITKASRP